MTISRRDVLHIARLARIALSDEERAHFERELPRILDFFAKLNEVDTAAVEPFAGGTDFTSALREDAARSEKPLAASHQKLVEAAAQRHDGYVEVKAVFDREA